MTLNFTILNIGVLDLCVPMLTAVFGKKVVDKNIHFKI